MPSAAAASRRRRQRVPRARRRRAARRGRPRRCRCSRTRRYRGRARRCPAAIVRMRSGAHAEHGRAAICAVDGRGAVAELGGADREIVPVAPFARCAPRRDGRRAAGIDHRERDALRRRTTRAARPRRRPARGPRTEHEALIEPVAAVFDVMRPVAPRVHRSPGRTTLRSRNAIGSMPSARASSSIADSTAKLVWLRP